MDEITKDCDVSAVLARCTGARLVFDRYGLNGCGAGRGPVESIEFFAAVHHANLELLVRDLNSELHNPSTGKLPYAPRITDAIYRRFFKSGIAIVLSIGAFWGAVNLLQIAL